MSRRLGTPMSIRTVTIRLVMLGVLVAAVLAPVAESTAATALAPSAHSMVSGGIHTCVLTAAGGVKCWGYNGYGELGDGTKTDRSTPEDVPGLTSGVTAVAAAGQSTCVVTTSGGVKCWGSNYYGELGDGTTTQRLSPVAVVGLTDVVAIAAAYYHTCALTSTGGVKCWGLNSSGQLGDGTTSLRLTPVDVTGLASGVTAIATGDDDSQIEQTCALTAAGGMKCWGANADGEVGDGTTNDRSTPVDVTGLTSGVSGISAGGRVSCAVTTATGAKCWGLNAHGQLGDGTTTNALTPVDVSGLTSGVSTVSVSQGSNELSHACASTTAGAVKCWGYNASGQVGNANPGPDVLTPADVTGLNSGFVGVATSFYHSCALSSAGGVKCWGENQYVEIGDGTNIRRLTPVDVSGSFFRPECPTLVASVHSTFALSDGYATGSMATFTADAGYTLVGSDSLTCQPTQLWSGSAPVAVLIGASPAVIPGSAKMPEGNATTTSLAIPVSLSGPSDRTVTAQWTTLQVAGDRPDQADPTTDYTPASGTVTFAPGETTKTVTVAVNGDSLVEPDEYVVVSFRDPTNAIMGGFWGLGIGFITNDDHAVVIPGFVSTAEGNSGTTTLAVPVTLSNPSTQTVTAQWTTLQVAGDRPDQADPTTDYTPASGTVTFAPGETTKTVTVAVNGDSLVEPDEYVVVSFRDPTNAIMGGFWGLGIGFITNDD